jgi:hypothetical protein
MGSSSFVISPAGRLPSTMVLRREEQFRSREEGVVQWWMWWQERMWSQPGLEAKFITAIRSTGGIPQAGWKQVY